MTYKHSLGEVIKDFRLAADLTQRKLASRAHISHNYLSEVERGVKELSSEILENIADGLRVPSYEIVIETGYRMAESTIPNSYEDFVSDSFLRDNTPVR